MFNRTSICSCCAPVFSLFCVVLCAAAEGSVCVALCVSEPLNGVQGALLASIMDIVGLRHGNTELLSPLTYPDGLKILQNSRDSHMLQLLLPRAETHTVSCESGTTPAPASTTTTSAKVCRPCAFCGFVYTVNTIIITFYKMYYLENLRNYFILHFLSIIWQN